LDVATLELHQRSPTDRARRLRHEGEGRLSPPRRRSRPCFPRSRAGITRALAAGTMAGATPAIVCNLAASTVTMEQASAAYHFPPPPTAASEKSRRNAPRPDNAFLGRYEKATSRELTRSETTGGSASVLTGANVPSCAHSRYRRYRIRACVARSSSNLVRGQPLVGMGCRRRSRSPALPCFCLLSIGHHSPPEHEQWGVATPEGRAVAANGVVPENVIGIRVPDRRRAGQRGHVKVRGKEHDRRRRQPPRNAVRAKQLLRHRAAEEATTCYAAIVTSAPASTTRTNARRGRLFASRGSNLAD